MRDERWLRRERAVQSSWRNCTEASESRFYLRDLADRIREVNLSRLAWSPQRSCTGLAPDAHDEKTRASKVVWGSGRAGLGCEASQSQKETRRREDGKRRRYRWRESPVGRGRETQREAERGFSGTCLRYPDTDDDSAVGGCWVLGFWCVRVCGRRQSLGEDRRQRGCSWAFKQQPV